MNRPMIDQAERVTRISLVREFERSVEKRRARRRWPWSAKRGRRQICTREKPYPPLLPMHSYGFLILVRIAKAFQTLHDLRRVSRRLFADRISLHSVALCCVVAIGAATRPLSRVYDSRGVATVERRLQRQTQRQTTRERHFLGLSKIPVDLLPTWRILEMLERFN